MQHKILQFNTYGEFRQLQKEWDALFRSSESNSHYLQFEFVSNWYECFSSPEMIRVLQIFNGEVLIGLFPLVFQKRLGVKILKTLTNYHCMHSGPLVEKDCHEIFLEGVASLLSLNKKSWDVLKIEYIYSFLSKKESMDRFCKKNIFPCVILEIPSYTVNTTKDEERYLGGLSRKERRNYKQAKNRLESNGKVDLLFYKNEEAKKYWCDFLCLEDDGWKSSNKSSIKRLKKSYIKYYSRLIDHLADNNGLYLIFLALNGEKIAGIFAYRESQVLHAWKSGFSQRHQWYSPANQLMIRLILEVCNSHELSVINLFSGCFGYKNKISDEEYSCKFYEIYNKSVIGILCLSIKKIKRNIKKLTKKVIAKNEI